jgi:GNAT superfamily N-acetyltransferase
MTPAERAQAHDANFAGAFTMLAEHIRGGFAERVAGVPVASLGVPVGFFNGVWPLASTAPEALGAAVARMTSAGLPFVVHVPTEASDLRRAASALGLAPGGRLPCFALEPRSIPDPPADLTIEPVDAGRLEAFWQATELGFEMPRSIVEVVFPAAVLEADAVRAFVGTFHGSPVATSIAVRTADTIGIYSVATAPGARGRGIGTAMTWHLLRDADPGWRVAVLQASDMGRPIYERMGFSLVREFDEYMARRQAESTRPQPDR